MITQQGESELKVVTLLLRLKVPMVLTVTLLMMMKKLLMMTKKLLVMTKKLLVIVMMMMRMMMRMMRMMKNTGYLKQLPVILHNY